MVGDSWVLVDRTRLTAHASRVTRHVFTRCLNCGNIEDPVILANRWGARPTPLHLARQLLDDLFSVAHSPHERGASTTNSSRA